jgi:hypothetical protein
MTAQRAVTPRRTGYLLVASATLALAGCATPSGNTTAPSSTTAGRTQWKEPARYSFVLDSRCGEQPLTGRFRVNVANGNVTETSGLDEPARNALKIGRPDLIPTLGRLVNELDTARRTGADVADIAVDPTDGHPLRITIDPKKNAIDDERCYTIPEYTPTSSSPARP